MHVCTRSFSPTYNGERITIEVGERVSDDHELVRLKPDAFEPAEVYDDRRRAALARAANDPACHEAGVSFHRTSTASRDDGPNGEARSAALRAVERHQAVLTPAAGDRLERAIRGDRSGADSAYLAAVAEPAWNSAFGKILAHGAMAPMRFTPEEHGAVQAVNRAEEMRAALAVGVGPTGGFAVPFALDPTIMKTSSGATNPIPELARTVTITGTNEWRGISTAGVTSNYGAEGSEVNDDAPTLAQPAITAERWTSFVPFSIEVGQDWASLQTDLADLMRDSKDTLDAQKMLTGTGIDEPGGILNIGGIGGLTTAQRVQTTTVARLAAGDVYLLKQALPPRFQPNAAYVVSPTILDTIYRFVPAGSTTEAPLLRDDRSAIVGRPVREMSTLVATTTTGSKVAIVADWKAAYVVVTRIGMQVELVNHLFGVNRRPTGERGLLAVGRTGAGTVNAAAARYLEIK